MFDFEGSRYEMILASDIDDAMTLELWEAKPGDENLAAGDTVLRIVRYNESGRYELTAFRENLSIPLIEYFITASKEALPPKQ